MSNKINAYYKGSQDSHPIEAHDEYHVHVGYSPVIRQHCAGKRYEFFIIAWEGKEPWADKPCPAIRLHQYRQGLIELRDEINRILG